MYKNIRTNETQKVKSVSSGNEITSSLNVVFLAISLFINTKKIIKKIQLVRGCGGHLSKFCMKFIFTPECLPIMQQLGVFATRAICIEILLIVSILSFVKR